MSIVSCEISTADDAVLFGHDPTPRLVAVHPLRPETPASQALMRVYQRRADDASLVVTDVPYYPFFFLSDIQILHGFPRARWRCKTLQGSHAYRYLVVCTTWHDYRGALRHLEVATGTPVHRLEALYDIPNPAQQYLMQSGRTLFKDMTFDGLHRLQLDLEVTTIGSFPLAERPEDRIILVALSDNRGWQQMLDGRQMSEPEMLAMLVQLIRQRDPDVIEGHNIYAFDLAYLTARCAYHGIDFAIGRDGSVPRTFAASMRFAERSIDFPVMEIAGRHVIDTYFQVMTFDVFKRDLPGYGLKTAARYFGLSTDDRTYIDGRDIAQVWQTDPERLIAYAQDDGRETERLARHLSGSTFYLTQMLPMLYGHVARTGPAAKIEALMVREYLRRRQALPRRSTGTQVAGGYTDVFVTGVVGPIVYADVESLYPSVMLTYDVHPQTDDLGLFQTLLRQLTALRLDTKQRMRRAETPAERSALDAQQSSYKILINSFYGQLGFRMALFNDFAAADHVATTGQAILKRIIAAIRQAGGTVVEVDTDGVFFIPPAEVHGQAAEDAFVQRLGHAMPPGIRLGYEGRYRKMLSYKVKNYALLAYDGTLTYKGSSLVSRAVELFGQQFVRQAIALLVDEDIQGLHDLYLTTQQRLRQHDWTVDDFARTETLKETLSQYQADVAARRRTRSAAYELAIARTQDTGQPVRKGDRITYYVTGSEARVTTFDHARLAEHWRPAQPDENTAYYLRRLDEWARKLAPFFQAADFRLLFTPDDLFGFSPVDIRLQTTWHHRETWRNGNAHALSP